MKNFLITFGCQYSHTPHPYNLANKYSPNQVHPDGWVSVMAEDYEGARMKAFEVFGQYWCFVYQEGKDDFDKSLFPRGELFVIK